MPGFRLPRSGYRLVGRQCQSGVLARRPSPRRGESPQLLDNESVQIESVVARHTRVQDAEFVDAQAPDRARLDRAAMDPDQRRDDRGVFLRQVEPVRIQVKEAGIVLATNDFPLAGRQSA